MNSYKTLLTSLSKNLDGVDISLLDKNLTSLESLSTSDAYTELTNMCQEKDIFHPEWSLLAGRLRIHQIKLNAPITFSDATKQMQEKGLLEPKYYKFVQ